MHLFINGDEYQIEGSSQFLTINGVTIQVIKLEDKYKIISGSSRCKTSMGMGPGSSNRIDGLNIKVTK